jgi:thioesterase domain-containing protein
MRVVFLPGPLRDGEVAAAQTAASARHAEIAVADFAAAGTIEDMAKAEPAAVQGPLVLTGFSMGGRAAMERRAWRPGAWPASA